MVADCASTLSSARPAEDLDLAGLDKQKHGRPVEPIKRCQTVENLEALLEVPSVVEESHPDFWTAIQVVMDEPEGEDAVLESSQEVLLADAEQPGALDALLLSDSPSSALVPSETSCELESDRCVSGRGSFQMGELLPGFTVSDESEINSSSTWMEVVVFFGQEIQRIRQSQGLSLDQIRLNTQIPVYQLEAMEAGAVDRLPEEIFVRGFLNRICTQLGPEGQALLSQLPASQLRPQTLLADWQQLGRAGHASSQVVHLRSAHLYIGYATLLAGAAGGLAWSFQETAQVSQPDSLPQPAIQKVYSQAKLTPSQRFSQLTVGLDVASPELMMPESSD